MADVQRQHTPLPGSWLGSGTRAWLGGDHLLLQRHSFYVESYRRFCLSDIQAFLVRKTADGAIWSVVLASAIGLVLLIAVVLADPRPALVACPGLGVLLLVNVWLGPTCRFHIRTAASLYRMPMLPRMRMAEKFLRVLVPIVNEAQGQVSGEEVRRQVLERQGDASGSPGGAWPAGRVPRAIRHCGGAMHFCLFSVMLAGAALSALEYLQHTTPVAVLLGMLLLAQAAFAIAAAVKQGDSDVPAGLKAATWLSVAYICVAYLLLIGFFMTWAEYDPEPYRAGRSDFAPYAAFLAVCSGALGLLGAVLLAKFRGDYRRRLAAEAPILLERA